MSVIRFWVLLLYPIFLLLVLLFCMCHVNLPVIHLFLSIIPLPWHLNIMIATALTSQKNGIISVTIVASSTTKLTSIILYMVVLLDLLLLLTLILSHNHLLWILLHMLLPTNLLLLMNFFNVRIVSPLVPLLLLPNMYIFCWSKIKKCKCILGPMIIYCDNKLAISIVHNLVQHDRTKHRDKLALY